jgi:hypothetical protein
MSWQGTMTCQLVNSLGYDIGNLFFDHWWNPNSGNYHDAPPNLDGGTVPPTIPAGGVLSFTINVGGSASEISVDQWRFYFAANGTWWSLGFAPDFNSPTYVTYKVCTIYEEDYDSGEPVVINFMPQGWSVDLPKSSNCPNNSYDSSTDTDGVQIHYYYDTALPSQAAASAWITSLYENILSRAPSSTEVSNRAESYANMAMGGSTGLSAYRDSIVAAMFKGGEYCKNQVLALYQNLLGRTPDDDELARQMIRLSSGMALQTLMARFCSSEEFIGDHPLPTAYTNAVYQKLLNRAPSDSELSTMQSGSLTPAQLCQTVIESVEFATDLANETYQTFLKRAPTTTEIMQNISAIMSSLQKFSAQLANSPEYLQNCAATAG